MNALLLLWAFGCGPGVDSDHGHGHGHGAGDGHDDHEDEALSFTRWTEEHELFVEFDAPLAKRAFQYHAHVTSLVDNAPVTTGTLSFRFEQDGFAVESHTDESVGVPGIFSSLAPAPSEPGTYQVVFVYEEGDARSEWRPAVVAVGADHATEPVEVEEEGEISFLKETQWQVPFSVTTAQERPMARLVSTAALVHAAPSTTAVVAAPVDGLLSWTDGLPVVGRMVERGERVATLIPAGAAEHWSGLQADMSTARVDRDLAAQELTRVEALAERDLLSERRLHEARASVERADAQLGATQRRVAALTSGSAGAMPVRAPASGLVVAVGAEHGTAVSTGSPLISVAAGTGVLIEAHVHDRALTELSHVASLSVLRGDWSAPKDLFAHGGRLLTERLVFDAHTLSAPLLAAVGGDVGLVPGDVVELQVGVGESTPRLAVPRSAIVEVNSQDLLFVQKTGETFARRRVVLGVADPTHVEVKSGLEVGERVVTIGGFDVHVASMSSQLESHRH